MITLKEWMEIVDYRITEGSDYFANVTDSDVVLYSMSSWDGKQDGASFFISFDPKTQKVYSVEACDYKNDRAYRLKDSALDVDDEAWDNVNFVDLESDDDFIKKAIAIKNGEEYDTRVRIPIELPKEEVYQLMLSAHERDITFNQLVDLALTEALEKYEAELRSEYGVYS